jgi:choline dehydrogenase-like flavoprotein
MDRYTHLAGVFITGEDPPQATNRISLHSTERDESGLPVPVIDYALHPNSEAMQQHANSKTTELFESLHGEVVSASQAVVIGCHNMGVARMSEKPKDGVTNRYGQVHDIQNLFVSDGSVFSSSAAAKLASTICGSMRVCVFLPTMPVAIFINSERS